MNKKVIVIGSGFAGLAAAITTADKGHDVTILEKNTQPGGRARTWEKDGFKFDMGPSWYWMPDVFENFFNRFGKKVSDYYKLERLDPSYRVYFGVDDYADMPAGMEELEKLFEQHEKGSAISLRDFLERAKVKYEVGMNEFVFKPSHSIKEYIDIRIAKEGYKIQLLASLAKHARKFFKNERLLKIIEFPVLFLGAAPKDTPAMYSLMNYADLALGTWYPENGMNSIIQAMVSLALEKGVKIQLDSEVKSIVTVNGISKEVVTSNGKFAADAIIASSDYEHTDQKLLEEADRTYDKRYWNSRKMSPSSLLFYLGVNKRIQSILHHNLFFHENFDLHAKEIYEDPKWPSKPLFYVCATSKTDPTTAPEGMENLFFLMPLAPGIEDTDEIREKYYELLINKFEKITGESIKHNIIVKRTYCVKDFEKDYNSFKGNAYGLSNTLMQTAFLKPKLRSKKVKNLFNAGQLTVPGPGVPPSLISGQVAANEVDKYFASETI